jgi:hypothetical protein
MKIVHMLLAAFAVACVALLSACFPNLNNILGGGGSSTPASVSGKWSLILTSSHGSSNDVDLEANISQSTGTISAAQAVILSSSPCEFGTDFLQGTVKGTSLTFTVSYGTGHPTITFSGGVSSDGLSMTGNYEQNSGDCASSDSGTWAASRFGDSSGTYAGQVTSATTSRVIGVMMVVQEDALNSLQVTTSLTNGGCSTLNLTGTAIGSLLQLANADSNITWLERASDPTFASFATNYTIGGTSCGLADNGSGTLSKTTTSAVRAGANGPTNPATHVLFEKILNNRNSGRD